MSSTTSADDDAPVLGVRRVSDDRRAAIGFRRPWQQRLRRPLMALGPLVVVVLGSWWYLTGGRYVSTEDAYVQEARVSVSADVPGRVVAIGVYDNERVKAGQVLFRLDARPFRIAVEDAQAQLAGARLRVAALKATLRQKGAEATAAEDTLTYQQREFARQQRLLASGFVAQSQFDQAANALELAREKVASTQHDVGITLAALGGNPDAVVDRVPMVQEAQAALDRARLNLSYTVVRASESGVVTKVDQLQVGDYVNASTPVFSLMSDRIWVEANFKETELTHMRPGQPATVEIDSYPDATFSAKLVSLSPGTGLTFALLPAENATGNWVKVVQRLPVRLALENVSSATPLHAGLSAFVEVDTGYRRPWLSRIEDGVSGLFGFARARAHGTSK